MKHRANKLFFSILLLLTPSICIASGDAGFIIKYGSFSLTVRFNITEIEEPDKNTDFLYNPEKLLFETLHWVNTNKVNLKSINQNITVLFYPQQNIFETWETSNTEKKNKTPYKAESVAPTLVNSLNISYNIKSSKSTSDSCITLFKIYSKEYIDNQEDFTDIYFGSLPGYMYNRERKIYYTLFWELQSANVLLEKNREKKYSIKMITVSADNIKDIFSELE